jgi:predicted DCC family thiol-disulfide oxidoreductase YuxK
MSTQYRFNTVFCSTFVSMQRNAIPTRADAAVPAAAPLTVYYDGACPVCSREIAVYRRQVGAEQCVWVDASSCPDAALGSGLSRRSALARFHVRRADGVLVDGMRGFAVLWRALPRFAWAGRIASIGPFPLLLDAAYRVFLRIRPLWQRAPKVTRSKEQR